MTRGTPRRAALAACLIAGLALACTRADADPGTGAAAPSAVATETATLPAGATPSATPTAVATRVPLADTSAREVERGRTSGREVALTFDCGWHDGPTAEILRILEEEDVATTWFMIGEWAQRYPDLTRRIAAKHEIANHSWSHPDYRDLTDAEIVADLDRADAFLRGLTGQVTKPIWRAPSAARDDRVLRAAAAGGWTQHIFWTLAPGPSGWVSGDNGDWRELPAAEVRANMLAARALGGGAILVAHCDSSATRDVLREVIRAYRADGFRFVTLTTLLRP